MASQSTNENDSLLLQCVGLAKKYRLQGQSNDALSMLDSALRIDPACTRALAWKSLLLSEMQRRHELEVLVDDRLIQQINLDQIECDISGALDELALHVENHDSLADPRNDMPLYRAQKTTDLLQVGEKHSKLLEHLSEIAWQEYFARSPIGEDHPLRQVQKLLRPISWGVVIQSGGHVGPHYHPESTFTGVLYLPSAKGEYAGGKLRFGRPMLEAQCSVTVMERSVEPRPGLFVAFPSYLFHEVERVQGRGARVSITFDLREHGP